MSRGEALLQTERQREWVDTYLAGLLVKLEAEEAAGPPESIESKAIYVDPQLARMICVIREVVEADEYAQMTAALRRRAA